MEDTLVHRRSKRSTAGNRMEAALAEMSRDDLTQDVEEDIDFVNKYDEEDVFESDFASTDEDAAYDEEAGEKLLQDEEKRARRAARQKSQKVLKTPARKVAFEPSLAEGEESAPGTALKVKVRPPRRVSLGQVVDAETGEILETNRRQSTREATRLNAQELQYRLKSAEGKRASLTKRPKETERPRTQAELIAAALDMEEHNIKSHREYLLTEEERRKKARVVKASTVGPKIRWRSRVEDVTVTVYDPVPLQQQPYGVQRPTWSSPYAPTGTQLQSASAAYHNTYSTSGQAAESGSGTPQPPATHYPFAYSTTPASTTHSSTVAAPAASKTSPSAASNTSPTPAASKTYPTPASNTSPTPAASNTSPTSAASNTSPTPAASNTSPAKSAISTPKTPAPPPAASTTPQPYASQYYPYSYYTPQGQPPQSHYQPYGAYYAYQPQQGQFAQGQTPRPHLQLHPPALPRKTTEKQSKNYVELLIDEDRPQEKPGWRETMDALFGKHVDWDNAKVYVGKNRPIARQIQTCPITGLQARYRDPRSSVPYANAGAFRILTRVLAHEYVWSPSGAPGSIGVYIGHEKQRGAVGVPASWGDAMGGVEEGWRKQGMEDRREDKPKEKEVRVGERRSLRIAAGETSEVATEADKVEDGKNNEEQDKMDVDPQATPQN